MLPLCAAEAIGGIPWSPQARGKLSRDWDYSSIRTETDEAFGRLFAETEEADKKVADRVAEVAKARGVSAHRLRCLAFVETGYYCPDRRRHQAAPSRRRDCRDKCQALRRGDRSPGAILRPARGSRLRLSAEPKPLPWLCECHAVRFSTRAPNADYLGFEASPEAIVTAAKKAEEVGFDAIFMNDHIIVGNDARSAPWTNVYDPFVAMSFIRAHDAHRGRRLCDDHAVSQPDRDREGAGDARSMSGGRLIAGIGAGWNEAEFAALGVPFRQRGARTNEICGYGDVLDTGQGIVCRQIGLVC